MISYHISLFTFNVIESDGPMQQKISRNHLNVEGEK